MDRNPNWPAQVFLVLLPAAVGCVLGGIVVGSTLEIGRFTIAYLTVALVFAVVGALAPALGIKKPMRIYRMLLGVGHSALSRQAILVGVFLLVLVVGWALSLGGVFALWLEIFAIVIGSAAVLSSGFTYLLRSQPFWRHWSTVPSLFAGLLGPGISAALVVALGWRGQLLEGSSGEIAALILVLIGVCLFAATIRWRCGSHGRNLGILGAAILAGIATAAGFASPWLVIVAFAALLAGFFLGRSQFFLSAEPLTWKAEVRWFRPVATSGKEG